MNAVRGPHGGTLAIPADAKRSNAAFDALIAQEKRDEPWRETVPPGLLTRALLAPRTELR